jgi:hypothetical protein
MQNPKWAEYFAQTLSSIASSFNNRFPEAADRKVLEAIEDKINQIWLDPDGSWESFQDAVGEYKMFFWKLRK